MIRVASTCRRRFLWTSPWAAVIALVLSVSPVFAQNKGGKPPPPPPSLQNSAIVYIAGDSIKVADADGANQVTLFTDRFAHLGAPSWAPDGDKIIFNSDISGEGIYEIPIDRSNGQIGAPQKILAHKAGILATPTWSPVAVNGRSLIAYEDFPPGSIQTDIYLFDPAASVIAGVNPFNLTNTSNVSELTASWSPDAAQLVVKTHVNNDSNSPYDVEILTLWANCGDNGSPVCEIAPRQSLVQLVQGSPLMSARPIMNTSWANKGNKIALSALIPPDQNSDVWVIEFDDSGVLLETSNLTNTNTTDPPDRQEARPTWSPNDLQIMYMGWDYLCQSQSNKKRGYNLIVRNANGDDFPEACEQKMIVEGGRSPSWWRGANSNP